MKGQLQSIVGDLTHIKASMETIRQGGKRQKKAIPREVSVRLGEYLFKCNVFFLHVPAVECPPLA